MRPLIMAALRGSDSMKEFLMSSSFSHPPPPQDLECVILGGCVLVFCSVRAQATQSVQSEAPQLRFVVLTQGIEGEGVGSDRMSFGVRWGRVLQSLPHVWTTSRQSGQNSHKKCFCARRRTVFLLHKWHWLNSRHFGVCYKAISLLSSITILQRSWEKRGDWILFRLTMTSACSPDNPLGKRQHQAST